MIVLDTHVFVWFAQGDQALPEDWRHRIADPSSEVVVPSIVVWEAILLTEKGVLKTLGDPSEAWLRLLRQSGFTDAPLDAATAALSRSLSFDHQDPADRFIAATAYALGAELATVDRRLRALPWLRCLPLD